MADANAVISGRNYLCYSTPFDSAGNNQLPADTVTYGTAWGTPTGPPAQLAAWVDRGYTSGGLGFSMNITRGEIRVDQEFDPLVRPITNRTITLSTSFAEMTPANIQLASGMGTLDTSITTHVDLDIGSALTEQNNAWGFDIRQPDGFPFRVFVPKGIATGTPAPRFTPDAAALIALEVSALVDTSTTPSRVVKIRDVIS